MRKNPPPTKRSKQDKRKEKKKQEKKMREKRERIKKETSKKEARKQLRVRVNENKNMKRKANNVVTYEKSYYKRK